MEEDTEYLKLPVEDRVVHKSWKARLHGYEEVAKLFRQLDDEKSPEFSKYLGLVKKFVIDSNAVAQEKGLEATLAFVECYASAGKSVGDVMTGIVAKCIAAPKTKTKELAVNIVLMYIEAEKADVVQEELIKGMEHKNPKISAACVTCMTLALREFGSKVIAIKPLVKKISSLLEDRDHAVREEGKAMVVEMYRWIGVALKPQLSSLKPLQVSELEAEFLKVSTAKTSPTRFLKSQQVKQAKIAAELVAEDEIDEPCEVQQEVDPYDLMDPVDILSQLPKDFYEKLEAKKWQERKECVDILDKLVGAPKLESGDYADLVRALKKVISKDSNVVVVAGAAKCMAGLASGLKKKFSPYAGACIPALLEKFKEKKPNVVTALRSAVDAIYVSTNVEAIQEDVILSLDSKNPQVKIETAAFLGRCFSKCTPTMLNKKTLKGYMGALLKMLNDPDPMVRDNSAEAIGIAMKVVGEKSMAPLINDLDATKQNKIRDCCEKAVIIAQVHAPSKAPVPAKQKQVMSAPIKQKPAVAAAPAAATKKSVVKKPTVTREMERELSTEEIEEKAAEIFSQEVVKNLSDTNWKIRLNAMEQFSRNLHDLEPAVIETQVLIGVLNKKPGFKDNNFQVCKARLDAAKQVAERADTFSSLAVAGSIGDIASNLACSKNNALTAEVLSAFAQASKLSEVATHLLDYAFIQKSPKIQAEALTWVGKAIQEFGFQLQPKALMDNVKKSVEATSPLVRNAGIQLVGILYGHMGQQLIQFFDSEKPALQQLIRDECDKHSGEVPAAPTRANAAPEEEFIASEVNAKDLMPHLNIQEQITDQLISQLKDKNWQVRMEGLHRIEAMISDTLISPNLGELPAVLCQRLEDSNAKIAAMTMTICQLLAVALGSQGKSHVRTFFPSLVLGLGDSKQWIRGSALECLNTWGENCGGFKEFFQGEMIAEALQAGSPQLREMLWPWLITILPKVTSKQMAKDELLALLPHLYNNLEDRNPDIRKSCQAVVEPIMKHLDYGLMLKATEKLKPGSRNVVIALLDKARVNMPVKEKPKEVRSAPESRTKSTATIVKKGASAVKPVSRNKKEEECDGSPLLQINSLKNQRSIDEQKLKVLKWNFTVPRKEFVELLREQLTTANASKTLIGYMFHADFKYHLKAIELLYDDVNANPKATEANLDLILKWMSLRFYDTNPSVLLKGLEYLQLAFKMLEGKQYNLFEYEASSFIPYLITKIGDPKDAVRNGVKALFKQIDQLYPHTKLFAYVMEGLRSKNARQRTECLDQLALLIELYTVSVCFPNPQTAIREIAKQIADRDNSVRNAALNCVVQAWFIEGEKVYKMLGTISDKEMSLLEERIKRASKNRVRPMSAPVQVNPPMPVDEAEENEECEDAPSPPQQASPPVHSTRTAIVKPRPTPTPGPFGLDEELLERIEGNDIEIPSPVLIEYDLDEILNDLRMPINIPTYKRPVRNEHRSQEQAIDSMISGIASVDITAATMALNQLDSLLQTDMAALLVNKVDQVVLAAVMQFRLLNQVSTSSVSVELIAKAYRTLLMMLITFYKNASLAERVSKPCIVDLLDPLLHLLADQRLDDVDTSECFSRVINILIVRIIEKSDHTNIICAFLKILHDCVGNGNTSPRYPELIMKCLWKIVKLLPNWESTLMYNIVLLEVHTFLRDYPTVMWKKRSNDMPVRTVKTILHAMVKSRGHHILSELDLIDNPRDSELEYYLNKLIKATKQCDVDAMAEKESQQHHHLSKSTYSLLSDVFKKIGSKDQTQEGLADLYDFKMAHPEADIEPFLRKSSTFFQQYIQEGMLKIEKERKRTDKLDKPYIKQEIAVETEQNPDVKTPGYYLSRLRNLQQLAGLEASDNILPDNMNRNNNHQQPINQQPINQLNEDKQELSSILRTTSSPAPSRLDQLRFRLEQVRGANYN